MYIGKALHLQLLTFSSRASGFSSRDMAAGLLGFPACLALLLAGKATSTEVKRLLSRLPGQPLTEGACASGRARAAPCCCPRRRRPSLRRYVIYVFPSFSFLNFIVIIIIFLLVNLFFCHLPLLSSFLKDVMAKHWGRGGECEPSYLFGRGS